MNWVEIWSDLVEGRVAVERASFTATHSELSFRDGGSPVTQRDLLERALLGVPLKVLAVERNWCDSQLSGIIAGEIRRLGINSGIRSVPASVVMLANAARRGLWLEGELTERTLRIRRPPLERLSPAVRVVAELYFEGLSGEQIAKQRERTARTVQNQLVAAHRRYGVTTRIEFISAAMRARAP
jgi:DNA-binding CsgD family transcriptional regulator